MVDRSYVRISSYSVCMTKNSTRVSLRHALSHIPVSGYSEGWCSTTLRTVHVRRFRTERDIFFEPTVHPRLGGPTNGEVPFVSSDSLLSGVGENHVLWIPYSWSP